MKFYKHRQTYDPYKRSWVSQMYYWSMTRKRNMGVISGNVSYCIENVHFKSAYDQETNMIRFYAPLLLVQKKYDKSLSITTYHSLHRSSKVMRRFHIDSFQYRNIYFAYKKMIPKLGHRTSISIISLSFE